MDESGQWKKSRDFFLPADWNFTDFNSVLKSLRRNGSRTPNEEKESFLFFFQVKMEWRGKAIKGDFWSLLFNFFWGETPSQTMSHRLSGMAPSASVERQKAELQINEDVGRALAKRLKYQT